MRVDWAVTCRYAESDGSTATIVGAGTDVLYVPAFPSSLGIMLAVRLAAPFEEFGEGQAHDIEISIEGPGGSDVRAADGSVAAPLTARVQAAPGAHQLVPGWLVTPLVAIGVQWFASEQGTYTLVVRAGDAEPSRSPVHVLPVPSFGAT